MNTSVKKNRTLFVVFLIIFYAAFGFLGYLIVMQLNTVNEAKELYRLTGEEIWQKVMRQSYFNSYIILYAGIFFLLSNISFLCERFKKWDATKNKINIPLVVLNNIIGVAGTCIMLFYGYNTAVIGLVFGIGLLLLFFLRVAFTIINRKAPYLFTKNNNENG